MDISIEKISLGEVDQLINIAIKTFKQSYEHLNSESNFKDYLSKAFRREKLLEEIHAVESFFYFVKLDKNIVGYLKLNTGNCQTEKHGDEYLEIERIYLDENYQRKGIGKEMIQFSLDKARALEKAFIWLGVWDKNPLAIRFYESMGFQCIGSHIFRFGSEDQIDILMEKDITYKYQF